VQAVRLHAKPKGVEHPKGWIRDQIHIRIGKREAVTTGHARARGPLWIELNARGLRGFESD